MHYLCYYDPAENGPKLEHAAYHHAVDRCLDAQAADIKWMEAHADQSGAKEPPLIVRTAHYWEKRICA